MYKTDPLTNEEFIPLRINQKFANPKNRIKFYNNKANSLRNSKRFVNRPLHKNLCILNDLMKGVKTKTFHKEFLLGKGYIFNIITHYSKYETKTLPALYQYLIKTFVGGDHISIILNPNHS